MIDEGARGTRNLEDRERPGLELGAGVCTFGAMPDEQSKGTGACERCGKPLEDGVVLVSSAVYWSPTPTFFLQPGPAFPSATMGRNDYYPFPIPMPAERCRSCGWVFAKPKYACAHEREPGFIFPLASLRWWAGGKAFQPSVWFTFTGKDKEGAECEILVRRGLVLSVVDTRVEGCRCKLCGSAGFLAEERVQAS